MDFLSARFHYAFAAHAPMLTVEPGTVLRVICPDCDNAMADGSQLAPDQRWVDLRGTLEGNPLAGPIYVNGAEPGDTLVVRIKSIELDRDYGLTLLAPRHGLLDDRQVASADPTRCSAAPRGTPRHMYRWSIDSNAGTATIENPLGGRSLCVSLRPFIGSIGVCPPRGGRISSLHCGPSGGNYDLPMIRAGTTIHLPVHESGALLLMGDLHAAQGHGEAIGGGIETSGKVTCTIDVLKGIETRGCRLHDGDMLWAVGVHEDLKHAIQDAYAALLDWLSPPGIVNRYDLYNFLSQTAEVVLGNLNESPYPVAAGVHIKLLPGVVREAVGPWTK